MGTQAKQSKLYSFYKAVITVLSFAVMFYLFTICFAGTYRVISGIGYKRILFLNSVIVLLAVFICVIVLGVYISRSAKAAVLFSKLEDERTFDKVMTGLKIATFIESIILVVAAFNMPQRSDQNSIQYSAFGLSWGISEILIAPSHLGVCPHNSGMVLLSYLLNLVVGNYNSAAVMLIFAVMVPFIYSDLAAIGAKFGLSRKMQVLVMVCGLLFLPLQAKAAYVYGDVPGLFFAVKAMKHASDIAEKKANVTNALATVSFIALACAFKTFYTIFVIAIALYLTVELLRQRRFKELLIPFAVVAAPLVLSSVIEFIVASIVGGTMSTGASKYAWIAMGMQEEAGCYNGYFGATFMEAGCDTAVQAEMAKKDIAETLQYFASNPNQALGFYIRKTMLQWTDPTYFEFELFTRNVYLDPYASQLTWFLSNPAVIRIVASFLKVFQLLMLIGGVVTSVMTMKRKAGTPSLLLLITFIGGFFFHQIWESSPNYAMPYMAILIPASVSGLRDFIRKLSSLKLKGMAKAKISVKPYGLAVFLAGTAVFLLAAAGIGTIRQILVDGRDEYKTYFKETLKLSRNPLEEGTYVLKPASDDYEGNGVQIEVTRLAGKYTLRVCYDDMDEYIYLTNKNGKMVVDWCFYDETQIFVILKNTDGTYSICQGDSKALAMDPESGMVFNDFIDYTFLFNDPKYLEYISSHPETKWDFVPAG